VEVLKNSTRHTSSGGFNYVVNGKLIQFHQLSIPLLSF
jgi:hypothetical protein